MGLAKSIAEAFLHALDRLIPKKFAIAIRAFPDFDDSTKALVLEAAHRKCSMTILVEQENVKSPPCWALQSGVRIQQTYTIRGVWTFLRSRFVFFTHGVYGGLPPPSSRVSVNLWHGMPLKRIGKSENPHAEVPSATFVLSTSTYFSARMAQAFGVTLKEVRPTGLPRNDLLLSEVPLPPSIKDIVGNRRPIVFLPTYRKSRMGQLRSEGEESIFGGIVDLLNTDSVVRELDNLGVVLLIKPHPLEQTSQEFTRISDTAYQISDSWLRDQNITLYELLSHSCALITDYSSVFVDYLLTQKPIYFYMPDLEAYKRDRGLYSDFDSNLLPGRCVSSFEELLSAMANERDDFVQLRRDFRMMMHQHFDAKSAARLLDDLGILS